MQFSIQSVISEALTANESRLPRHWSPSKLGSCLCGVYLERIGVKPDKDFDERTLRVFSAGRFFEDWAVGLLKGKISYETQVQAEWPEMDANGYADVVIEKDGEKMVYEIKSKNSRSFWYMDSKKEGPNRQHEQQLWYYLERLGIEEGRILYLEKDSLSTLEYVVRRSDERLRKEVVGQLELLNRAWKEKIPPPPMTEGWQPKYCRWHSQCTKQQKYLT